MSYKFEFMGIEFCTEFDCPFPGGFTAKAVDAHEVARLCEDSFEERVKLVNELAQVAWLMVNQRRFSIEWDSLDRYIRRVASKARVSFYDDVYMMYLHCVKDRAGHKYKVDVAKNMVVNGKWRESFYLCGQCHCLHPIPEDGEIEVYRSDVVCPSCIEELGLVPCPVCGKLYRPGEERLVWRMDEGEWKYDVTCGECDKVRNRYPFYCAVHQRWEIGQDRYYRGLGYACEHAESELVKMTCSLCGHTVYAIGGHPNRTVELFGREFSGLCEECERKLKQTARISAEEERFAYGFKPMTVFFDDEGVPSFKDDGSLHMGFELELDGADEGYDCDEFARTVHREFGGFIYCKSDCSLDIGAESVSQPATPSYLIEKFDWDELVSIADSYYLSNESENCGFHVHMNRKFFEQGDGEEMNIAKLTILFDRFYSKFAEIGRRNSSAAYEWARASYSPMNEQDFTRSENYKHKLQDNKGTRYHAVNTCNANTVEIRLFSATTNVVRIKFMLDVLQAVANIVIKLPVMECLSMTLDEFKQKVSSESMYSRTAELLG